MKPFLVLQLRPETEASDNEYEAFLKFGEMDPNETHRIRMETDGLESIDLDKYSAVIVGGGPYNISDKQHRKDVNQLKFEKQLFPLMDEIIERDFPYLGACYGLGLLALKAGGLVSKEKYSEEVGATTIKLTKSAKSDPLTSGLPENFRAFVGHKEASQNVPETATHIGLSKQCPIQMIRVKNNVYGTQFHPELDSLGLALRIKIYKDAGYFPPDDADKLISLAKNEIVNQPEIILKRFVKRYRATS